MFHCLSKWDRGDVQPTVAILDTCKGGAHGGGGGTGLFCCVHIIWGNYCLPNYANLYAGYSLRLCVLHLFMVCWIQLRPQTYPNLQAYTYVQMLGFDGFDEIRYATGVSVHVQRETQPFLLLSSSSSSWTRPAKDSVNGLRLPECATSMFLYMLIFMAYHSSRWIPRSQRLKL